MEIVHLILTFWGCGDISQRRQKVTDPMWKIDLKVGIRIWAEGMNNRLRFSMQKSKANQWIQDLNFSFISLNRDVIKGWESFLKSTETGWLKLIQVKLRWCENLWQIFPTQNFEICLNLEAYALHSASCSWLLSLNYFHLGFIFVNTQIENTLQGNLLV